MIRLALYRARRGAASWRVHRHSPPVFFYCRREWSFSALGFVMFVGVGERGAQ